MFLNVYAAIPPHSGDRPPTILVHGAANSALVWKFWQRELATRGWSSYAIDLRGHGDGEPFDLSSTSMHDYAADVLSLAEQLKQRPIVVGWSMGGLVAMMIAASGCATSCVALAPSTPAAREDLSVELRTGVFGPEEYGIVSDDPDNQSGMLDLDREERQVALGSLSRESRLARDERRQGIIIESIPCPLLIVTGTMDKQWPAERYNDLWLQAERINVEGASHWGLALNRRALAQCIPAVLQWIEGVL